ncbi:DUF4430 domain-containing protein [Botrimarina sp.]|uniref:DUF4430 domain-containing protein n=1 Tax=Botrimarina sp. TaxID=2795802 RepID=UPI0032ED3A30
MAAALVVVLLAVVLVRLADGDRSSQRADPAPPDGPAAGGRVTVAVRRPGEPERSASAVFRPGMTVADATRAAFPSRWRGEGAMAFLDSLDGTPSDGPEGLNWQFEVNGAYGELGAGAVRLAPGDRVLWRLAPYE